MPTLKEIQENLEDGFIATIQYDTKLNSEIISFRDKDFKVNCSLKFDNKDVPLNLYKDTTIIPIIIALKEKLKCL
jgi:hypothetical protein